MQIFSKIAETTSRQAMMTPKVIAAAALALGFASSSLLSGPDAQAASTPQVGEIVSFTDIDRTLTHQSAFTVEEADRLIKWRQVELSLIVFNGVQAGDDAEFVDIATAQLSDEALARAALEAEIQHHAELTAQEVQSFRDHAAKDMRAFDTAMNARLRDMRDAHMTQLNAGEAPFTRDEMEQMLEETARGYAEERALFAEQITQEIQEYAEGRTQEIAEFAEGARAGFDERYARIATLHADLGRLHAHEPASIQTN